MQKPVTPASFAQALLRLCENGLLEDAACEDITSDFTIENNASIPFKIVAREEIVVCGIEAVHFCFNALKQTPKFKTSSLQLDIKAQDGELLKPQTIIAEGLGDAKLILAAERVILNVMQHLSGISTLTRQFVQALDNDKIKILDTRKTFPGARILQKYAVKIGGGCNHRFNLSDAILIKDNHIAAAGGIKQALQLAKKSKNLTIEIECDTLEQVAQAVEEKPDVIMLDNMDVATIEAAINIINQQCQIEISGGVDLQSIQQLSHLNVDFISVGALTHSVKAIDIGLDI